MPNKTDPERLVQALLASGWQIAGKRTDVHTRLSRPELPHRSIVVPAALLDAEDDLMLGDALTELRRLTDVGRCAQAVLNSLQLPEMSGQAEQAEPWAHAPEVHVYEVARAFPTPRLPHLSPAAAGQVQLAQARLLVDRVWREAFVAGMVYESARKPAVVRIEPEAYDRMKRGLDG